MKVQFADEVTTNTSLVKDIQVAQDHLPATVTDKPIRVIEVTEDQIERLGDQQSTQLSSLSKQILSQVRASDADAFGAKLNDLIGVAKSLDPSKHNRKGILAFLRSLVGTAKEKMLAEYQTVEGRMTVLIGELDKSAALQSARVNDLEDMYLANMQTHQSLEECVSQGQEMLVIMQEQLESESKATDAFSAQRIADQKNRIDRLEKRIDDIRRSMLLAKQAAPEIRLLQDNARTLASKFKDVKAVTIPAWQNAFSLYLVQLEQKKSAELITQIHDTTDEAFKMQADMLRENTVMIAKAKQRSVVSIETLEHVQNQLLGAFDDMNKIAEEGKRSRKQAEVKLVALEKQLVEKFVPKNKSGV